MRKTTFILLLILSLALPANAATRYVSENLFTYMHSGPGTKYKIIGSVNAGAKIQTMQTKAGFTQIKDSRGRTGWINSQYVSKQIALKERFKKLETEFTQLDAQLQTTKNNLTSHNNQVRQLKNTNEKLTNKLQEVEALNNSLNEKLDNEQNELLMRWFSYGGMVGGIGLFLGLILPSLIPNRKKRNRW